MLDNVLFELYTYDSIFPYFVTLLILSGYVSSYVIVLIVWSKYFISIKSLFEL